MDRVGVERRLAEVERQLADALRLVLIERERIKAAGEDGCDAPDARGRLLELEELHAMHVAEAERLRRELGAATSAGKPP